MGKTSRKKKQQHVSREEANAAAGQIVRIGEKEKCSNCKNWVKFGFTLRLGNPPHRAQCGPNAKCDGGCGLNLCHNCLEEEECRTDWYLCTHNKTGTSAGARNECVSKIPVKFCTECTDVESKARKLYYETDDDKGISDMEHQKNHALIYCGGFDRGSCMAAGSVRKTVKECRECALSGERMMRICYCCGKIRCVSCIGFARDQGGDMMGETISGWNIVAEMGFGMGDMMKAQFISDFIKRCGDCGRDVCMECTSEETLASNMSKARLFDCKESGCRCVSCMTKERMASKIEDDTSFKCDECRQAKLKCHNPGCNNRYKFVCTRCGKANYCSRECQVATWSSHKPDCQKKKNSSKQKEEKEKKKATSSRKDKAGAKLNRNVAKEMIDDLKNAHASFGRD